MKMISYRGGVVQFRIPPNWVAEYEPEGGGTFYENRSDSPTLRLNVVTLKSPRPVTIATAEELLSSRAKATGRAVELLGNGRAITAYSDASVEDDRELMIWCWEVASPVPPQHARVAVFTLAILKSHVEEYADLVRLIDREVRACQFAPQLGT